MNFSIEELIDDLGEAPRKFPLKDRLSYLKMPPPFWLKEDRKDDFWPLFKNTKSVLRNGTIVWGHIVQANNVLFGPDEWDAPGAVVYSFNDIEAPAVPEILQGVARHCFSLKETQPDEPLAANIAHHLTDEYTRVHGLQVPTSISPILDCKISSTFFFRKHLPGGYLHKSLLPLFVIPSEPHFAFPVPGKYWPMELKHWWEVDW